MRRLDPPFKFMVWAAWKAVRHPKTKISYNFCTKCGVRVSADENVCPLCNKKIGNPRQMAISPVPWYCSVLVIVVGIGCWIVGACVPVHGLDEAGRAMVYVPLGNMFGMSIKG